jgi:hypothetical protein
MRAGNAGSRRSMENALTAEAQDRRLNRLVAVTVVLLLLFTSLDNIKDGNLVQTM